jgi:hypothetical protein
MGRSTLGQSEGERRVLIPARLHGRGRLSLDRLSLLGAATHEQVVEERSEMAGTQVRGQPGEHEGPSAGGDPRVGRNTEHAGDAQKHLGLLLCRQRVAHICVSECARLLDLARGVEQDRGLGEKRCAELVVAGRQIKRPPAEIRSKSGISAREGFTGAQQDRDRLLVPRLRAPGDLGSDLDRCRPSRQKHVGGLAVECASD